MILYSVRVSAFSMYLDAFWYHTLRDSSLSFDSFDHHFHTFLCLDAAWAFPGPLKGPLGRHVLHFFHTLSFGNTLKNTFVSCGSNVQTFYLLVRVCYQTHKRFLVTVYLICNVQLYYSPPLFLVMKARTSIPTDVRMPTTSNVL